MRESVRLFGCRGGGTLCNAMILEPGLESLPAVVGCFFPIGGVIVGVKGVWYVGIEGNLARLVSFFKRFFHLLDALDGNAGVGSAVKAKDGGLELADQIDRVFGVQIVGLADEAAIPGDASFEIGVMG